MSQGFIPLHSKAASVAATPFRLERIPYTEAPGAFSALAPAPTADPADHAVEVDLQREGDRVTGARIRCRCGRVVDLAFTF
jgi:hypothetical protein